MKKMLALMMTLALLLCGAAAFAEAQEAAPDVVTYDWDAVKPYLASGAYEGKFYSYEDPAFTLWIPDILPQHAMTQEMVDRGIIDCFTDDADLTFSILVRPMTFDESVVTAADLIAVGPELFEEFSPANINGVDAVVARQENTMNVFIPLGEANFLQLVYDGISDQSRMPYVGISIASIQMAADSVR